MTERREGSQPTIEEKVRAIFTSHLIPDGIRESVRATLEGTITDLLTRGWIVNVWEGRNSNVVHFVCEYSTGPMTHQREKIIYNEKGEVVEQKGGITRIDTSF